MQFSLVRFSFVRILKTVPKYMVQPIYTLFDRANPSFVLQFVTMCIIDFIFAFMVRNFSRLKKHTKHGLSVGLWKIGKITPPLVGERPQGEPLGLSYDGY